MFKTLEFKFQPKTVVELGEKMKLLRTKYA